MCNGYNCIDKNGVRQETVDLNLNVKIKKDLKDTEVVCSECKGLGIVISDNNYTVIDDFNNLSNYKNPSLIFCTSCYNGVQNKCEHCGKVNGRSKMCSCDGYKKELSEKIEKREQDKWDKAEKFNVVDLRDSGYDNMVYLNDYDDYFDDIDSLIDYLHDEIEDGQTSKEDVTDMKVYFTKKIGVNLDAHSIMEYACEELHEDAFERIDKLDLLQDELDIFVEKYCSGATTYIPDYSKAVVLKYYDLI
jgi:hypothetical protein